MRTSISMIICVAILMCLLSVPAFAQISFAILPMETRGDINDVTKETAESALYQHLIGAKKYRILERSRIEEILKEQAFQSTGATDESEVVEIGKILGVEKLLTSTLYLKGENQYAISASVIDVATAQVEFSREFSYTNYLVEDIARVCAANLIAEYPLLSELVGKAGEVFVVGLGKNHGIKEGDRLFVARREIVKDDETGEVLFQQINRIGTLRVTKVDAVRSMTKILALEQPENPPLKGDLVSPEPVPKRDVMVASEPLLSTIAKGKLLLEDNMETRQYLSPTFNEGKSYLNGKLHLNGTKLTAGQVYCYYPSPFESLENIIMEGDVEFQPIESQYNRFSVVIRNRNDYLNSDSYNFYWNDEGGIAVYQWRLANPFEIVPLQSSPIVKRGDSLNTFRIVAYGAKFDFYLNDEFIAGFEEETLEKGRIGFMVESYGYVTIDNVNVWEAVKQE
ncbi:hypothetical protein U14_02812 [Candidatus Moduliflexus flocculans]|uniref:Curli production assembly/transport component CsgG n=1 Tax=Candidatus Moduliflexus flocculans TaxID=1499966 RepID=A0A081BMF1_9BACT|nr:hypothetical protein U14_02812 [Candidatus Moduliflexus flocculans]